MKIMDCINVNTTTRFSNFQVLNSDFTRCKCNVFYTGKNRNGSIITDDALKKLIERHGYANVPVVGHIKTNKQGRKIMGSHDRKLQITDDGIEEINECTAMGVVPLDANPRMEKIIGKDGIEKEYFTVDVILWTNYFPELMQTNYNDEVYFNHSMEINCLNTGMSEDGYTIINDFSLQALCMLGKYDDNCKNADSSDNSEPCFEDSRIRRFSIDENEFKRNFEIMLNKFKQFETGNSPVEETKENFTKEEKTLDFTNVIQTLSNVSEQFSVISCDETTVSVFDKTDYSVYTISYTKSETDGVESVEFDLDNKVEKAFAVADKTEDSYNLKGEIENIVSVKTKESVDYAINTANENFEIAKAEAIKEISEKYEALSAEYEALKAEKAKADEKLNEYAEAEKIAEKEAHEKEIMGVIDSYSQKLGSNPEYLMYKTKIDYSKTKEQVDIDMLLILGKADRDGKMSYSYNPVTWGASDANFADNSTNRYGNLFDKVKKD